MQGEAGPKGRPPGAIGSKIKAIGADAARINRLLRLTVAAGRNPDRDLTEQKGGTQRSERVEAVPGQPGGEEASLSPAASRGGAKGLEAERFGPENHFQHHT
jgi:hypothetical protein